MIEPVMYVTIGFLAGCLIVIGIIPAVHARAVRLTMLRLEMMTPMSMEEIRADNDLLRAESMSTSRLEMMVEQMKAKTTSQLAEISRLKLVVEMQRVELATLRAQTEALKGQIKSYEKEIRELHERFRAPPLRALWEREQSRRRFRL
jgi:chromosome segregation ATPase